ncbi:MAG: hypothetical protein ABIP94_07970, partial [Planctomycetota bacterium]
MSAIVPESSPTPKAKRSWLMRLLRRTLRVLLWSLLALSVLLVVVWFFRRDLVVPLLRPQLEALLKGELGAERVSIGAFDGDWIGSIDVSDVAIEGAAPPLRTLRGGRVQARYSLWALLCSDLSGLREATVTATFAEVDLRPVGGTDPEPARETTSDLAPYEPLLRLCPEGARVQIDRVRLLAPDGEREAPLDLNLRAGSAARKVTLAYAGVGVEADIAQSLTAAGTMRAQIDVNDPGTLLDLFGVDTAVREGTLHAAVVASIEPPRIEARVDLSGLVHRNHRLEKSHIVAWFDGVRLAIDSATIDLPGLAAELNELTLPNPFLAGPVPWQELAGKFLVRVDDLSPHVALLPEPLRALMPIRARLAGSFAAGSLRLDPSDVQARGLQLSLEQGSFPLASADWRAAEGSMRFRLALTDFQVALPSLGETALSGGIVGTLAGSLDLPRLEVQLDLGKCRTDLGACTSATGLVRGDVRSIAVEGLHVQGLLVAAPGGEGPSDVQLDARCGLRDGAILPDSLVATVELASL